MQQRQWRLQQQQRPTDGRRHSTTASASTTPFEGSLVGSGLKFAVVVARFNDLVTKLLLEGAVGAFESHGADVTGVEVRCWGRCCCASRVCDRLVPAGSLG